MEYSYENWRVSSDLNAAISHIRELHAEINIAIAEIKKLRETLQHHLNHCDYCKTVKVLKDG